MSADFMPLAPELVLAAAGMLLLLLGVLRGDKPACIIKLLAIIAFVVAGAGLFCPQSAGGGTHEAFHRMFIDDAFARFVKVVLLASSALSLMLSVDNETKARFEYPVLVIFATLGMFLMVSAGDLLSLYVGLELQSLTLYVLAAFRRDDAKSSEAGLKYFVLGALSSGLILYGISLVYGYAGTTQFAALGDLLKAGAPSIGVVIGMVFICAAMAFKVSAVPFHMWTPDVYEGAPTPVTAFFSAAPKVAALALLTRLLAVPLLGLAHQWEQIIIFMAVASMALGSFAGLVQANAKRLLAYSSIANVGYALVALSSPGESGVQALLIYLAVYFLNTLGAFGVVLCLRRQGKATEQVNDFAGLARTNPMLALAMAFFMFSLAGVPPFAGFFGKYFVFLAAVKAGMVGLAIFGVLTSVVAAYYYLRIIKLMYFDEAGAPIDPVPEFGLKAVVALAAIYMLILTLWPSPVIDSALAAARSLTGG